MASLLNMSGGSLLNKGLPYDAEIEYLQINHSDDVVSIINTENIFPDRGYLTIKAVVYKDTRDFIYPYAFEFLPTLSNITSNWQYYRTMMYIDFPHSGYLIFEHGTSSYALRTISYPATVNLTDTSYYVSTNTGADTKKRFRLYKDITVKWFFFQIKDSNKNILFDLIPVRKGTTGYLYDKVSGQLFGNQGTGNFILGNDI